MVEVFKTNVDEASTANEILGILHERFPFAKINFDIEDCDNILRVEADLVVNADQVITALTALGYRCERLEDEPQTQTHLRCD